MNPASQRFEDRMFRRLAAVERELQALKNAQRLGLDNFVYAFSDTSSASFYIESGQDHTLRIDFISATPTLYASELSLSFFINTDLDDDHHWPDGAALDDASGLRPMDHFEHYDLWVSDELGVGRKTYYIRIVNVGAFAKTIHLHASLVFPTGNVT